MSSLIFIITSIKTCQSFSLSFYYAEFCENKSSLCNSYQNIINDNKISGEFYAKLACVFLIIVVMIFILIIIKKIFTPVNSDKE